MRKINLWDPKIARLIAFVLFLILFLAILHRPRNFEEEVWERIKLLKKGVRFEKESLEEGSLEFYLEKIKDKPVFKLVKGEKTKRSLLNKRPSEPMEETTLDDVIFNGIIILDKKYVAIYDKKIKVQHLIAEGEEYKGIKVLEIKEDRVIIRVNNEEKEIRF